MNPPAISGRTELRAQCRAKLSNLSAMTLEAGSLAIAGRLNALLRTRAPGARSVAVYWPIHQEPRLQASWDTLRDQGCRVGLPRVVDVDAPLEFVPIDQATMLIQNRWGITEAGGEVAALPLGEWQIIVMPCVGFDPSGFRLGYGGGFYDRTLQQWRRLRPDGLAIGVAFDESLLKPNLPVLDTDRPCDFIVTPARVYSAAAAAESSLMPLA